MDKSLKKRIGMALDEEYEAVQKNEQDPNVKLSKLNDILHMVQILDHYEELEPLIANHINEKAQENKFRSER